MSRHYLRYRLRLEEPLVAGNGSQIGNIVQTHDYLPGSAILGVCAGLYIKEGKLPRAHNSGYTYEFRSLFLSDETIYSPAYPLAEYDNKQYDCFPMPLSVFGCKYHGSNVPGGNKDEFHGFDDYLFKDIPDSCAINGCDAPMEHKTGYCYDLKGRWGFCNHEPVKRIVTHNKVGETNEEKGLFSYESLERGQIFYGEISFSSPHYRDVVMRLIRSHPVITIGTAKGRGYGRAQFLSLEEEELSCLDAFSDVGTVETDKPFSITLFSDAVFVDDHLNYPAVLDKFILARCLGIDDPDLLIIFGADTTDDKAYRSFYKAGRLQGFNQHRRMPLPMEKTIVKGSVFTVKYTGNADIRNMLRKVMQNGIGVRRNEGLGMVVINHRIHKLSASVKELKNE